MLDKLSSADFLPYLHQPFRIRLEGLEPIELELVSVTESGDSPRAGQRRPFSLQFLGPVSPKYLLQRTYALEHAQMGLLELFIVPLGPENQRMRYEAIFN